MIIYVHSYDMFDAGSTWGRHRAVSDVSQIVLQQHDTVATMVQRIMAAARNERSIYTLIINAHGLTDAAGTPIGEISLSDDAVLSPPMYFGDRMVPRMSGGVNMPSLRCEAIRSRHLPRSQKVMPQASSGSSFSWGTSAGTALPSRRRPCRPRSSRSRCSRWPG